MPNIITHVLFARELAATVLDSKQNEILKGREQLYEIGSNGPDFLFFHGINPKRFKEKSHMRSLGTYCHRRGVNDFYHQALEVIRNEKEEDVRKDEIVYMMGHLTHWALDSCAHPYIFWRTGSGTNESGFRHHKMESLLDAIVLKVKAEKTIKDFKAYTICDVDIDDVRAIARIYVRAAQIVYGVDARPHEVLESLNDWFFIQKVLYDQKGKKLKTYRKLEGTIGKTGLVSAMVIPNEPEDPCDICNLLHKPWTHPCDNSIGYTDSFFDLYDQGLQRAKKAIRLFLAAVDDCRMEKDFMHYLDNRNYTKGFRDNPPMKYFDPDMEKNGEMMLKEQK